ncbi:amino acid permease [Actinocatenispora thailandica]|uniref:Amino acid permease n=1 Tax=Actinocatenispora thailandica TaxID=227318 RepID=A0A7R7DMM8_9ACTN|nr:APC family permease [Actinocatenispora thailandica]BCJ34392.1 amino acid permease [Actinocatenispora thailandica]
MAVEAFPASAVTNRLARNRLSWGTLGGYVIALAAPLTVVGAGLTNGWAVTGLTSIPIAYLAVALILWWFAVGYVALGRRIPNAGALYVTVAAGIGRVAAVAAGLVAVVSYAAMEAGLLGGFGVAGARQVTELFGPDISPWWVAIAALVVITVLGVLKVNLAGRILAVALVAEIAAILVFDVIEIAHPHGSVSFAALNPVELFGGGGTALVGMVIALTGLVGFEDSYNYSEEAKKGAPWIAVYGALAFTAAIYALSAWAMTVAAGPGNVVAGAGKYADQYLFHLVSPYVPGWSLRIAQILLCTSLLAAAIGFSNTGARYFFALGRDRVLPGVFGRTWSRTAAPAGGAIAQSVLVLTIIVVMVSLGADPETALFFGGTVFAGYGVLLLMTLCCAAALVYFVRHRRNENVWQSRIAPVLGFLGLAVIAGVTTVNFGTLVGIPNGSFWARALPAGIGAVAVLGIVWGLLRRVTNRTAYGRIGQGGRHLVTGPDPVPEPSPAATSEAVVLGGDG